MQISISVLIGKSIIKGVGYMKKIWKAFAKVVKAIAGYSLKMADRILKILVLIVVILLLK